MYDVDDPRSALNTSAPPPRPVSTYGGAEYARFYAEAPQEDGPQGRTWFARGQNFITAVTLPRADAVLTRENQIDEYAILLPDRGSRIEVSTDKETQIMSSTAQLCAILATFMLPETAGRELTDLDSTGVVKLETTKTH